MVTNSLTKLLTNNPSVGEEISKLTTKEDILAVLKKHISGYTEEQMLKDFSEIKTSAEFSKEGALNAEALENVAGGAGFMDWVSKTAAAFDITLAGFQQTKEAITKTFSDTPPQ